MNHAIKYTALYIVHKDNPQQTWILKNKQMQKIDTVLPGPQVV
jgi:hypothetical protein